ncbi:hypothetical protein [Flavobacterium haoranii]|uniref:Uncharacterized protein n=1 Tax=Flavobacterium haoranii TaxID=683124 RepID=A0A1M6KBD8_9FLAO|nr:hypothetical protein [Flavobacterium haoranii]SHJ56285.1 hypothetical protein SAMN05444337_2240 [Flavobacterium haoranii]
MARKHFMIYYQKGSGTYVVTEPMPWARENKELFVDFDFNSKKPTSEVIEKLLIEKFNFKIMVDDNKVKLIQNLNPNLSFKL